MTTYLYVINFKYLGSKYFHDFLDLLYILNEQLVVYLNFVSGMAQGIPRNVGRPLYFS